MSIDLRYDESHDILQTETFLRIQALINSGKCFGVWFAPPCASWSSSRRHDEHKHAPPLRSAEYVMGLPDLKPKDQAKVMKANAIVRRTYALALSCIINKVPFAIENPYHSLMWSVDSFRHLQSLPSVTTTHVDFCMYGEDDKKSTKILSYGYANVATFARVCHGKGGMCERTRRPHELLNGVVECPQDKLHLLDDQCSWRERRAQPMQKANKPRMIWKTKLAEPYPEAFCEQMATMMSEHPAVCSAIEAEDGDLPVMTRERPPSEH